MKTCNRGHELTPDNVYKCGKYEKCKACIKIWNENNVEKKKVYNEEYRKLPGIPKCVKIVDKFLHI